MTRAKRYFLFLLALLFCMLTGCSGSGKPPAGEGTTAPAEPTTLPPAVYEKYEKTAAALLCGFSADTPDVRFRQLTGDFDRATEGEAYRYMHREKKYDIDAENYYPARKALDDSVRGGANLVLCSGKGFEDIALELAEEYPDVLFFCQDSPVSSGKNCFGFTAKIYEAFYLAGIAAAGQTRTGRLAFLASANTPRAGVCNMANAFALGALSVSEDVQIYLRQADTARPDSACAAELSQLGCDIFAGNFDNREIYQTISELGRSAISFQSREHMEESAGILADVSADFSGFFAAMADLAADGKTGEADSYFGGLGDGAVQFTVSEKRLTPSTLSRISSAQRLIQQEEFSVFSGYQISFESSVRGIQAFCLPKELSFGSFSVSAGQEAPSPAEICYKMNDILDKIIERGAA